MDEEYKRQVKEFHELWHNMIAGSKHKDAEQRYTTIKKLSTTEISVIRIISEKEEVIIKDILEVLRLPKSTLTSMIDRLEKKGFIVRSISSRDRRSYRLVLTEKGKKAQKEHIKFEEETFGNVIEALDTYEEREEFLRLMKKIAKNILKKSEENYK
ncbi:MarR family transcriptional regulator [Clostridium acetobutylicum]|nr:MarR family transcriptional regulator [Clostridium acetobutylicum]